MPKDPSVVQNYGSLLEQLVQTVPDGLVPTPGAINLTEIGGGVQQANRSVCKLARRRALRL